MLTFLTETGRRITAASLQDAEAIASEFNLGRIIDSAPRKRRAAKAAAPSQYIIWDELCLSVRAHGLTNVAAYMAAEAPPDHEGPAILTASGRIRDLTPEERRRLDEAIKALMLAR